MFIVLSRHFCGSLFGGDTVATQGENAGSQDHEADSRHALARRARFRRFRLRSLWVWRARHAERGDVLRGRISSALGEGAASRSGE